MDWVTLESVSCFLQEGRNGIVMDPCSDQGIGRYVYLGECLKKWCLREEIPGESESGDVL